MKFWTPIIKKFFEDHPINKKVKLKPQYSFVTGELIERRKKYLGEYLL